MSSKLLTALIVGPLDAIRFNCVHANDSTDAPLPLKLSVHEVAVLSVVFKYRETNPLGCTHSRSLGSLCLI